MFSPKFLPLILSLATAVFALDATAETSSPISKSSPWRLTASAHVSSPLALEKGLNQGLCLTANTWFWGPFFWGAEIKYGTAEASNFTYRLVHQEMMPNATLGTHFRSGRVEFGVISSFGIVLVREHQIRHGSTRISNAGLQAGSIRWTSAPNVSAGPVLKLEIIQRLELVLRGGANWAYLKVNDEFDHRISWFGSMGLGYRL